MKQNLYDTERKKRIVNCTGKYLSKIKEKMGERRVFSTNGVGRAACPCGKKKKNLISTIILHHPPKIN